MDDEPDVRLVHAHPEGDGGDYHGEFLALLARRGVDDAGRPGAAYHIEYARQLVFLLLCGDDPVGQVGAIEARHDHLRRAHLERDQDVLPDAGRRRCREGEYGRVTEIPYGARQEQVVGAEVVAPLRDAVGLVNYEEADAGAP